MFSAISFDPSKVKKIVVKSAVSVALSFRADTMPSEVTRFFWCDISRIISADKVPECQYRRVFGS